MADIPWALVASKASIGLTQAVWLHWVQRKFWPSCAAFGSGLLRRLWSLLLHVVRPLLNQYCQPFVPCDGLLIRIDGAFVGHLVQSDVNARPAKWSACSFPFRRNSIDLPDCTSASVAWPLHFLKSSPSPPTSAILRQNSLQRSAAGLAELQHHSGPLLHPSTTVWLSTHTVSGGTQMWTTAHSSARSDDGHKSGHGPYQPAITSPSASTKMHDQPARLALTGALPRMAPSVNACPVKVKSGGAGRPPHHLTTGVGAAGFGCKIGRPCWNNGSSKCMALAAFERIA